MSLTYSFLGFHLPYMDFDLLAVVYFCIRESYRLFVTLILETRQKPRLEQITAFPTDFPRKVRSNSVGILVPRALGERAPRLVTSQAHTTA
jgi:hypothetical protein